MITMCCFDKSSRPDSMIETFLNKKRKGVEGFAEKEGFKPGMKERRGDRILQ